MGFFGCSHEECDLVETSGTGPNIVLCQKCKKRILETKTKGIIYDNLFSGKERIWRDKKT